MNEQKTPAERFQMATSSQLSDTWLRELALDAAFRTGGGIGSAHIIETAQAYLDWLKGGPVPAPIKA